MTPLTTNEETVAKLDVRIEDNYFHRTPSLPKMPTRYHTPYVESSSNIPMGQKDPSYQLKTHTEKPQQSSLPLKADGLYGNVQETPTRSHRIMKLPIRRKEVGSAILRRRSSSSGTIIHNVEIDQPLPIELPENLALAIAGTLPSITPKLQVTTPGETTYTLPLMPPAVDEEPFLDILRAPFECGGLQENEAIVTSYQLALTSQTPTHLPSLQNRKDTSQANRIHSLQEFPPAVLKDPISARIPSNPQSRWIPFPMPVLKSTPTFPPTFPQQRLGKLNTF
jgi:hypothetical protein